MLGFLSDNLMSMWQGLRFLIKYQKMEGTSEASTSTASRQR